MLGIQALCHQCSIFDLGLLSAADTASTLLYVNDPVTDLIVLLTVVSQVLSLYIPQQLGGRGWDPDGAYPESILFAPRKQLFPWCSAEFLELASLAMEVSQIISYSRTLRLTIGEPVQGMRRE